MNRSDIYYKCKELFNQGYTSDQIEIYLDIPSSDLIDILFYNKVESILQKQVSEKRKGNCISHDFENMISTYECMLEEPILKKALNIHERQIFRDCLIETEELINLFIYYEKEQYMYELIKFNYDYDENEVTELIKKIKNEIEEINNKSYYDRIKELFNQGYTIDEICCDYLDINNHLSDYNTNIIEYKKNCLDIPLFFLVKNISQIESEKNNLNKGDIDKWMKKIFTVKFLN